MGFAAPLALLGLLALAGPILAHLLRRQRLRRSTLPTVALLERARAESDARLRVADPLLLALRLLALAMLALGLAQPYLSTAEAFADGRRASLALVLDDSMSMAQRHGTSSAFDDARDRALDAIDGLADESEVAVVLAGTPARLLVPRTKDREAARLALRSLEAPGARGTDLDAAVQIGQRALAGAPERRRLLLLSDFAAPPLARWPPASVAAEARRVGPDTRPENVALTEVTAAPDPTQGGALRVRLVARGTPGSYPARLRWRGDTRAEGVMQVQRGAGDDSGPGRGELVLTLDVDSEAQALSAELLARDALPDDDRRGVLLRPPSALRVLVVRGGALRDRRRDATRFITRALEVVPRRAQHRVVDRGAFRTTDLDDTDVVIWANARVPGVAESRALRRWAEAGGGLFVVAGERSPPRALRARLGSVLPATPGTVERREAGLESVSAAGPAGLTATQVRRFFPLEARPGADVWLRVDGAPVLVLGSPGEGRSALLGLDLGLGDSDLPLQPGFVPLLDALLGALAPGGTPPSALRAGDALPPSDPAELLRIERPDGTRFALTEEPFEGTALAGVYRVLTTDGNTRSAFVVAPPAAESDLSPGAVPAAPARGTGEEDPARRRRRPLSGLAFLLAGLAVVSEGLLRLRRPAAPR